MAEEENIQPEEENIQLEEEDFQPEEENIQPLTELHDIQSWTTLITSKIQENEEITASVLEKFNDILTTIGTITTNNYEIKHGMVNIGNLIEEQDRLNAEQIHETAEVASDEPLYEDKLSPTAKRCIEEFETEGPLDRTTFQNFLLDKSFGKPRPPVLPIIRGYITNDIRERFSSDIYGNDHEIIRKTKEQLLEFQKKLKRTHVDYMEEHKKDENLKRRIDRLVLNIGKEMAGEVHSGMSQPSITGYFRSTKKRRLTKE